MPTVILVVAACYQEPTLQQRLKAPQTLPPPYPPLEDYKPPADDPPPDCEPIKGSIGEDELPEILASAQTAVAETLKDPDSAKFRNLYARVAYRPTREIKIARQAGQELEPCEEVIFVCGELNGKNSYGGYVGFRRFAFDTELGPTFDDEDSARLFREIWRISCEPHE